MAAARQPTEPFRIAGTLVPPGRKQRLELPVARLPTGTWAYLHVVVLHGRRPGKAVWLSGALHGDELNGVEIIRRVLERLDPRKMCGTVVAVPVVNVFGFLYESRYLPDRRDLNRSFPGSARGSTASRLAHLMLHEVVGRCGYGIDLHTGSDHRANLPHIRADLTDTETRRCATAFAAPFMMHSRTKDGSLREAATRRGCHVLLYEGGEALRFDAGAIDVGVNGVLRVLGALDVVQSPGVPPGPVPVEAARGVWVRAPRAGLCHLEVELGDRVEKGAVVARVLDPYGTRGVSVRAPVAGLLIGCARNPVVHRGDAILHLAKSP